jgi:glycosyltransferase involved in cell wall biosynthesis
MISNGISLVIFCYNSAKRIEKTLNRIIGQKFIKEINWEIVIVDNNSTDDTLRVTEKYWSSAGCSVPFRFVTEKKQGLSYARLTGIKSAAYDIVAFIDDDNRIFDNWVETAYEFMNSYPQAGLCGGQTFPDYENPPGEWFEQVKHTIAIGKQGNGIEDVTEKRKFVWGAGALIRRSLVLKAIDLGFSNITASRVPNFLGGGDDWELACIIRALKAKIYYNEELKLYHYIPASRTTWEYIRRNTRGYGYSSLLFDVYEWYIQGKYLQWPAWCLWIRQMVSFIKPSIKYGFLLPFIGSFPKGSPKAMKLEYIKGRFKAITGMRFSDYSRSISSMKKFFGNLGDKTALSTAIVSKSL